MSHLNDVFPCGRVARRDFFKSAAGFMGCFMGGALGTMWAEDGKIPDVRIAPTLPVKAKSCLFLFMCGGVSHIDTFDPKDNKFAGKLIDAVGFGDNLAPMQRPFIPMLRTFTRYGKSGKLVSDWFPNVGGMVD